MEKLKYMESSKLLEHGRFCFCLPYKCLFCMYCMLLNIQIEIKLNILQEKTAYVLIIWWIFLFLLGTDQAQKFYLSADAFVRDFSYDMLIKYI